MQQTKLKKIWLNIQQTKLLKSTKNSSEEDITINLATKDGITTNLASEKNITTNLATEEDLKQIGNQEGYKTNWQQM